MTIESDILQNLSQKVDQQNQIYVAFSGGLDSSVLLHVLAQSEFKSRITAVHIHHGLSENADDWLWHCERASMQLSVPLIIERVHVHDLGQGIEAAARDQRLRIFSNLLEKGGAVVTAHHQSDQVETFFYRALRGAGLTGLSAMASSRGLGSGQLIRPMLAVPSDALEYYAKKQGLTWVEDESNSQTRFDRNYLRACVVPALKQRWSAAERLIASTVENIQESKTLLDAYVDKDLVDLDRHSEELGESLDLAKFMGLASLRQDAILRRWCEHLGAHAPEKKQRLELVKFLRAKDDAQPCLSWGSVQLRRFRGRLYLLPSLDSKRIEDCSWNGVGPIELTSQLHLRLIKNDLPDRKSLKADFKLRFDKAGLRCQPRGRAHSQTIKKLFQEYEVPPWLRPVVPLIFLDDELIAVGGCWECNHDRGRFEFIIEQIA